MWSSHACEYGCSDVLVLGVLEVIGGKGRGRKVPWRKRQDGVARRAQRCDRRFFAMKKSLRFLIGCVSVVSDWCSLCLCDAACLRTEFTILRSGSDVNGDLGGMCCYCRARCETPIAAYDAHSRKNAGQVKAAAYQAFEFVC